MSDTETPPSSPSDGPSWAASTASFTTLTVLGEVLNERRHQVEDCRWTPEHDDQHHVEDFAWLIARRAVDMCHHDAAQIVDARRLFVEISAISVAAIEAIDRKHRDG